MKSIPDILREKKLKATPQRLAIYEMLLGTTAHPSAETIYKALKESNPSMSLATVYKTLESFKKVGLVQELNTGEDSFRYDAVANPHIHTVCETCKAVGDHHKPISVAMSALESDSSFSINRAQIYLFGTCHSCASAR